MYVRMFVCVCYGFCLTLCIFFFSHSDGGKFKRIPVFRGPSGGFGFAAPYEFDSIYSLVLFYANNRMDIHNSDLQTTLKCPAFLRR